MEYRTLHGWDLTPDQARELQKELARMVRQEDLNSEAIRLVAGSDMSFEAHSESPDSPVTAGFAVLRLPERTPVARTGVRTVSRFPYIPGLLSFREVPPLLEAWSRMTVRPDVVIADGQGLAHPRRFGLACHLGLLLDIPTIGVGKTRLLGTYDPVPEEAGSWSPLMDKGEVIGAVLRTRTGVSPVYVSVGHRIDLPSAIALVMRCVAKTRLPETTRAAHDFVNMLRRSPDQPLDIVEPSFVPDLQL